MVAARSRDSVVCRAVDDQPVSQWSFSARTPNVHRDFATRRRITEHFPGTIQRRDDRLARPATRPEKQFPFGLRRALIAEIQNRQQVFSHEKRIAPMPMNYSVRFDPKFGYYRARFWERGITDTYAKVPAKFWRELGIEPPTEKNDKHEKLALKWAAA